MQASLLTVFIKCNVHSIHKIPDVPPYPSTKAMSCIPVFFILQCQYDPDSYRIVLLNLWQVIFYNNKLVP